MEQLALTYFPFPHVFRGERHDGSMSSWADRCLRCADRECERSVEKGLRLCRYGVNFQRVDADLLVAGIVVRDYPGVPTEARQRALRRAGKNTVTRDQLARTIAQGDVALAELQSELQERLDRVVEEYRASRGYEQDVVDLLRPELQQTLAQVHDYKQFVQQITQNIDVILEQRFPGEPIDRKLDMAEHEETAIYWAAQLMDEKLDAALYLMYPERIHELRDRGRFRFHGLVTKYRKIYQRQCDAKRLRVHSQGESRALVEGNGRAISIIPHTFIDNAVKYAPEGSSIILAFEENHDSLTFSVESFGPPILPEERAKICELFFRGSEARRRNGDGTGFGLASAQNVARVLDLPMSVTQDDTRTGPEDTRFTVATVTVPILAPTASADAWPARRAARPAGRARDRR